MRIDAGQMDGPKQLPDIEPEGSGSDQHAFDERVTEPGHPLGPAEQSGSRSATVIAAPTANNGASLSTSLQLNRPRCHQCQMSSAAGSVTTTDFDNRPAT